jgi:hypothetical protein
VRWWVHELWWVAVVGGWVGAAVWVDVRVRGWGIYCGWMGEWVPQGIRYK